MLTDARFDGREVTNAMQRILASRTFARSERLRAFLKYIVETEQAGLAHQLKGYTIGIDVFGRSEGFDPGIDPLVRVQAGKLRKLLNQFYTNEGREEPLRIRIPTGAYVPIYEGRGEEQGRWQQSGDVNLNKTPLRSATDTDGSASKNLPALFICPPKPGDHLASVFINATRLWRNRLWAVAIASADGVPRREMGAPHPLHFELEAEAVGERALKLGLRHVRSNREVPVGNCIYETSGDSLEVGMIANQFAATNLTIPGAIYRFCHAAGLATGQMKCLEATYRYSLERTDAAYVSARRCQQQWPGLGPGSDIITEINKLISLSALAR